MSELGYVLRAMSRGFGTGLAIAAAFTLVLGSAVADVRVQLGMLAAGETVLAFLALWWSRTTREHTHIEACWGNHNDPTTPVCGLP